MEGTSNVFAIKHKNIDTRIESQSGGMFTALSDVVLSAGGVVYGCVLNEDFDAIHIRADNAEMRNRMRGSKYVQSNMTDIFRQVQRDLVSGKQVIFTGTSCQVGGLKSFLGGEYPNLLCVDIVCHGVPSPKVWKRYIEWQEENNHGRCVAVNFRNKKKYGWNSHYETLVLRKKNGTDKVVSSGVYKTIFYEHNTLRPSCYRCPYKSTEHPGDITIADCWGIENAIPGYGDDNMGVSLVIINTEAGKTAFDLSKDSFECVECDINKCMQPTMIKPFAEPLERKEFWSDFQEKTFSYIAAKYGKHTSLDSIKIEVWNIKRKIKGVLKSTKQHRSK